MKKTSLFLCCASFAAMSGLMCSCSSDDETGGEPQPTKTTAVKETNVNNDGEAYAPETGFDKVFNSNATYQELAGKTDFAVALAKKVGGVKKNFVVSPLSMQMAFAMLANGAEEDTYKEITETVGMEGLDRNQLREYARLMIEHYVTDNSTSAGKNTPTEVLQMANSVWADYTLPLYKTYLTSSKSYFSAETYSIDFTADDATQAVNGWVSEKTNGKIPSAIDDISNTVALLINTVYMKASWATTFSSENNVKGSFRNSDGTAKECEMLHATRDLKYNAGDKYDVASLDLGNFSYTMNFILPHEDTDAETVLNGMDAKTLGEVAKGMKSTYLDIEMPKFKVTSDLDMMETMREMGIKDAFDAKNANFGAMSPKGLFVNKAKHNTYIDVNEEGVEAAAASTIGMGYTSSGPDGREAIDFHIDRPFLFTIQDTKTGAVIFAGRVMDME